MNDVVKFGTKEIVYEISFSKRKTLGIIVKPDSKVIIKAPADISKNKIKEKVLKRAGWILKQQNYFTSFFPKTPERRYIGGETHLYLGRQYLLKIRIKKEESVKLKGKLLEITTDNKEKVKILVKDWYLKNAKKKLREYAEIIKTRFKQRYKAEPIAINIREMATRWGSCTKKGRIILNPELIKAPKPCIEYVILHEMCHLIHHNHTQKFIDLLNKEMPDWEKRKNRLERFLY